MSNLHSPAEPSPRLHVREEGGGHRAAALAVLIVAFVVAAAAVLVYVQDPPAWTSDQWYFVVDLADALVYAPVAFLLLTRSRSAVAWLVALTAVGGALAALGFQWSLYAGQDPELPQLRVLSSMQNWAWMPGTLSLVMVVPWLVRDDRLDRRARWSIGAGVAVIAWFLLSRLTDPWPWYDGEPIAPFPIRDDAWATYIERVFTWQIVVLVALGLWTTVDVVRRWRTRGPDARRGLGWLAIGSLLVTVSFVPLALPESVAERLPVAATPLMHLASQLFYPAAILVVVLGQRLWGVDVAVSRAVSWGLLTALLTVAYVTTVSVLSLLWPNDSPVQQVVATAFVAAGFQPVKVWVQGRVDRLVHGDAAEPMNVVRRLGRRVGSSESPEGMLDDVATGIRTSLRLRQVGIVVAGTHGDELLASSSDDGAALERGPGTLELPLRIGEQEAGRLIVRPRPGERLDGRSERSLEELTPIVAATVQLTRTTKELTRSRARLADARDAERRRLRRELHDGLGPALAGIGLALQASRNLLVSDPGEARSLIDQMVVETERRVEEVRAMARDLLPPSLEGAGLAPALGDLVELYRGAGVRIELESDPDLELSAPTATAAYAIASEAVRNVVRHAAATTCLLRATSTAGSLELEVLDDGVGIGSAPVRGVGLTSMQEWAEELGGTVVTERVEPRGTRVLARLPLMEEVCR
jgi:signal transduction histidine kinase